MKRKIASRENQAFQRKGVQEVRKRIRTQAREILIRKLNPKLRGGSPNL